MRSLLGTLFFLLLGLALTGLGGYLFTWNAHQYYSKGQQECLPRASLGLVHLLAGCLCICICQSPKRFLQWMTELGLALSILATIADWESEIYQVVTVLANSVATVPLIMKLEILIPLTGSIQDDVENPRQGKGPSRVLVQEASDDDESVQIEPYEPKGKERAEQLPAKRVSSAYEQPITAPPEAVTVKRDQEDLAEINLGASTSSTPSLRDERI